MSSNKQPVRRKKTKEEIKRTRARVEARVHNVDRKQVSDLRKDRQEIQGSLSEVVQQVRTMHMYINSDEIKEKVPAEVIEKCSASIKEFKKEIDENKEIVKQTITSLQEMEDSVLSKQSKSEDIVLSYNLTATPLMDTVIQLTQKGTDTLMSCAEELSKFVDNIEKEESPQ